jgi:hypothetical protein
VQRSGGRVGEWGRWGEGWVSEVGGEVGEWSGLDFLLQD